MQKMLRYLKDATIVATLNQDGSVNTVAGYSEVASQIFGSTNAISPLDKQRLQQQWRSMVEQAMVKRIWPDFPHFPEFGGACGR